MTNKLAIYNCPKVAVPPVIDGKLDDETWAKCPVITLVRAETGEPATKNTRARMCWDDTHIYVSFECADTNIWGTFTEHDDPIFREDVVEFFVSPTGNLTDYYELNVSPRNVVFDSHVSNPTGDTVGPDTLVEEYTCQGMRTAVLLDGTLNDDTDVDRSYSVEYAIPFAAIGAGTPEAGEQWRANLYRIDRKPLPIEYQAWSPTMKDPANFHIPEHFGVIVFCEE